MELMTARGYQEDGEAAEKWRRVQLTSTQLCTYYVGYCEVRDLVATCAAPARLDRLRAARRRARATDRRRSAICARCCSA